MIIKLKNTPLPIVFEESAFFALRHEALTDTFTVTNNEYIFVANIRIKENWQIQVFKNNDELFYGEYEISNLGGDATTVTIISPLINGDIIRIIRPSYLRKYSEEAELVVGTIDNVNRGHADLVEDIANFLIENNYAYTI